MRPSVFVFLLIVGIFAATSGLAVASEVASASSVEASGTSGMSACASAPGEIGLVDCLVAALETNPRLLAQRQDLVAAQQRQERAASAGRPKVSAQETFTRMREPQRLSIPLPIPGIPKSLAMGDDRIQMKTFKVTQPLYTGGAIPNSIRAARSEVAMQGALETRDREDIAKAVVEGYFNVLTARALVEVASQALIDVQGHERQVQIMREAGSAVKNDLLKIQVSVLERRENLLKAENSVRLACTKLENLTGLPISPEQPFAAFSFPASSAIEEKDALIMASQTHPLLQMYRENLRMRTFGIRAARSGLRPTVGVQWDWNSGTQLKEDQSNWDATLVVGLNLFDGGETRAKVREAEAGKQRTLAEMEDVRRNISLGIQNASLRLREAVSRLDLSQQAERQAEESKRLTEESYNAGAATSQSLLDAESALVSARERRVTAEFDRQLAMVALWHAIGDLQGVLTREFPPLGSSRKQETR